MSSLGNVLRDAPRHVALGAAIGAVMAFIPADADQHASAVAMVTATVYAPVTIRSLGSVGQPTVHAATPHAYSLRLSHDDASASGLRTIFIYFE